MKISLENGKFKRKPKYPYLARYCGVDVAKDGLNVIFLNANVVLVVDSGESDIQEGSIHSTSDIPEDNFLRITGKVTLEF